MMFGDKILKYKDELLADLNTLIGFESVANEKPEECQNAINFMLKRANDFGLTGEQVTDESMHIQLGSKGKLCGVLSHLDVVPAGNNWSVLPYSLTEKDGRLYGRGIADDKGAALVTLYCLRALKEEGIDGVNTLRAITVQAKNAVWKILTAILKKCLFPTFLSLPTAITVFAMPKKVFYRLK